MERHSGKKLGIPCGVISAPVHIQNFPLGYRPFFGYEGANQIADLIYNSFTLGMEDHLLEIFGGHDTSPVLETQSENLGQCEWDEESLKELQNKPIRTSTWIVLVLGSLSISGLPLLTGFGAKTLTMKHLLPWQEIAMNIAVVGTATVYAKLIFLPHGEGKKPKPGFWAAIVLLLGWLFTANVLYPEAYTVKDIGKALVTIAGGWLLYWLIFKRTALKLPRVLEEFDHLIGVMSLVAVLLFWMAFSWLGISY